MFANASFFCVNIRLHRPSPLRLSTLRFRVHPLPRLETDLLDELRLASTFCFCDAQTGDQSLLRPSDCRQ